jgi:exopolysaccharide biosynthesis polyprenyl glycosylphosphotransferase
MLKTPPESMHQADPAATLAVRSSRVKAPTFTVIRVLADLFVVLAGFAISYHVYAWLIDMQLLDRNPPTLSQYFPLGLLFTSILLVTFWRLGLYRQRASVLNLWEVETAVKGFAVAGAFFFALLILAKLGSYSRLIIVGGMGIALILTLLERRLISALLRGLQLRGRLGRRVLIYGCGETGMLLMKKIVQAPHTGCTVIGFLDDDAVPGSPVTCSISQTSREEFRAIVLGSLDELSKVAVEYQVDELLVARSSLGSERAEWMIQLCHNLGLKVGIVPHLGDFRADQVEIDDLSAIPVLRPHSAAPGRLHFAVKRLLDVILAAALLLFTAPISLLAALAIRLESSGPVIFTQDRVGQGGRLFRMYKFRTMRLDVDPYATAPTNRDDPRITRVGRVVRLGGIDELPQFLNVLRGEMSLVGPRPEMPFIVERYTPLERLRLGAKPGITGLWQLSPDRHTDIHENIEYDLYYLRHQSLLLDALILLETVFFAAGAILHSLFPRLPDASRTRETSAFVAPTLRRETASLRSALDGDRETTTPTEYTRADMASSDEAMPPPHVQSLGRVPGNDVHKRIAHGRTR